MISILMCDDNREDAAKHEKIIQDIAQDAKIDIHIKRFTSGAEMLMCIQENPKQVDIIFQDVIINELNGIEIAKKIREIKCNAEIVFLTNRRNYVFAAFETNPLNYLIKSEVNKERMREIFLKAVKLAKRKNPSIFTCERNGIKKSIPIDKISYFESNNRVVTVYFENEEFEFYATLESVIEKVEDSCIRIHRSYAVNIKHITEIKRTGVTLKNGKKLPIGITHLKNVKKKYEEFIQSL